MYVFAILLLAFLGRSLIASSLPQHLGVHKASKWPNKDIFQQNESGYEIRIRRFNITNGGNNSTSPYGEGVPGNANQSFENQSVGDQVNVHGLNGPILIGVVVTIFIMVSGLAIFVMWIKWRNLKRIFAGSSRKYQS